MSLHDYPIEKLYNNIFLSACVVGICKFSLFMSNANTNNHCLEEFVAIFFLSIYTLYYFMHNKTPSMLSNEFKPLLLTLTKQFQWKHFFQVKKIEITKEHKMKMLNTHWQQQQQQQKEETNLDHGNTAAVAKFLLKMKFDNTII